jgi:Na+-driven multidrug efflux pump
LGGGLLQNPFHDSPSLSLLWVGLCAEIVLRAVMFSARYLNGGWLRVRV